VKIGLAATNGQFPSDYDIARAIVQMWKKVGIDADLQVIEYAKYFELNRASKLPEATLYSWDNATGDPEIFSGYLLNPKLPFSAWKDEAVGGRILKLFNVADYNARIAGYRDVERFAVEQGATIPLLQSVLTVVRKRNLQYTKYGNGWVLPQTLQWS
jgi:peptide/nickel transport system substrate-binding protein